MKAFFAMAAAMMISVLGCHTAQAAEALGTLTMDNDNGDRECSIPIERGYYYYKMADTQCKNDEATKFKLSGVVAGVEIRFCGGDNCKSRDEDCKWPAEDACFRYKIKTLKRDSSLEAFKLSSFENSIVDSIPHKSFKIMESEDSPKISGKLSRVEIRYCNASDNCSDQPAPRK
ncbi:hypothetical protein [Pseudomonas maumuensis]|uniref:Uncharacterized protein n=1 Tax=Pseudomonas maumuensis TaxID=2842354 RepID=A0ABX8NGT3_9PSED|nr:hypothetical protein [Pseudomonas maumuensis]QXH55339.1 hypothetical protein KSS90_18645 [Pseudomonas maumuensis]